MRKTNEKQKTACRERAHAKMKRARTAAASSPTAMGQRDTAESSDAASGVHQTLIPLQEVLRRCYASWVRVWPPACPPPMTDPEGQSTHIRLLCSTGGTDSFSDPFASVPLPDGGYIVADYGNHQLKIVAATGQVAIILSYGARPVSSLLRRAQVVRELGQRGRSLGQLLRPRGLALTDYGLYVTDDTDRVQAFDLHGVATRSFPARAEGAPAVLCRPHGLARGPNGLVYVADTGHQRVAAFLPGGALSFAFGRAPCSSLCW